VSQSGLFGLYTPVAAPIDIEKYIPMNPEQHPGDKTSSWSFLKVDLDTFMLMNNAIRAEVTKFEALLFRLGDRQLHTWEKEAIKVREHNSSREHNAAASVSISTKKNRGGFPFESSLLFSLAEARRRRADCARDVWY
jgi:hypothetical protein